MSRSECFPLVQVPIFPVSHECGRLQPRVPSTTIFIVRTDRLDCFPFKPNYIILSAAFILSGYVWVIKWKYIQVK